MTHTLKDSSARTDRTLQVATYTSDRENDEGECVALISILDGSGEVIANVNVGRDDLVRALGATA